MEQTSDREMTAAQQIPTSRDQLYAQIKELRATLSWWAKHERDCPMWPIDGCIALDAICNCGYDELVRPLLPARSRPLRSVPGPMMGRIGE